MYEFGYLLAFNVLIAFVFYALGFTRTHREMVRNVDAKGFDTFQTGERIFVVREAVFVKQDNEHKRDTNATQ